MTVLQGRTGRCKRVRDVKALNFRTSTHTLPTQVNRPTRPLQDISVNSLIEKQRGRKHSSYSPTSFSEPLPTDPASTEILWRRVRAWSLAGMAPPKVSHGRKLVSPPSTRTSSCSRGGKSVSSAMTTNTFNQSVTVKDAEFREKTL
jgi:hypothetical protein